MVDELPSPSRPREGHSTQLRRYARRLQAAAVALSRRDEFLPSQFRDARDGVARASLQHQARFPMTA